MIRHCLLLGLSLMLPLTACQAASRHADKPAETIDRATARKLAAERFNQIFSALYLKQDGEQAYFPIPQLTPEDFSILSADGEDFVLDHAPPAGIYVKVKVSKEGKSVEVVSFEFSSE